MAKSLIESLSEPWDPEIFKDEYREALLDIVEKKLAGEPVEAPSEVPPARVVDLMAALKASVEAAKAKTPAPKPASRKSASTKKPASKKPATKKPAAKKAPAAKKPAARRTTATRKKAVWE
jgi:DNA end-binding protein Ku